MKGFPLREQVEQIKKDYPVGTKLKLLSMQDPHSPVPSGTEGEVVYIDSIGTLKMKWDNGRTLGIIVSEDSFEVISRPDEPEETMSMGGMSL